MLLIFKNLVFSIFLDRGLIETYCGAGRSCSDACNDINTVLTKQNDDTDADCNCLTVIFEDGDPKEAAKNLCDGIVSYGSDYCCKLNGTFNLQDGDFNLGMPLKHNCPY